MELRVLRYFRAVAEAGSISDAAKALHVTQPTLSRQLAQLEEELGAPLLTRGRHGVELTERGAVLSRYARDIAALADKATEEVAVPESSVTGTVHIGAGETRAFSIVAEACARVRERHPGVSFDVHGGVADDLKSDFARGFYDLLLDCDSGDNADFHQLALPMYDTWGVTMRRDDLIAALDAVTPEDLANRAVIVSPQGASRALREWAGDALDDMIVAATYALPYNAVHLIAAGIGVMLSYSGLGDEFGTSGDLCFRPLSPVVEAHHKVLWRKTMPTKPTQALISELEKLCEER